MLLENIYFLAKFIHKSTWGVLYQVGQQNQSVQGFFSIFGLIFEYVNFWKDHVANEIKIGVIVWHLSDETHFVDGHDRFFIVEDWIHSFLKLWLWFGFCDRNERVDLNTLDGSWDSWNGREIFADFFDIFVSGFVNRVDGFPHGRDALEAK